ncbi:endolytic transglycosylase MltG [Virgisporangium aliadipatigenens]|uniref:endolytic transglycosylase MltG n=1 Tax=Virgisporangium aliadipatigenens TaxID=741659 RepID=UPI0019431E1F|nr:endolytic transglycosylase MltG [Virgisporangium aliadipatigenens]
MDDERDFELSWEDDDRSRRRRGRGGTATVERPRTERKSRTGVALVLALVILVVLGGGAWYGFEKARGYFDVPDYNSGGTGETQFEVKSGATAAQIGTDLVTAGVVKSQKAFVEAAKKNARSKDVQPGFYRMRLQMRASDALAALLNLTNKVQRKVTVPEGEATFKIYELLAKATNIPEQQFKDAAKDTQALGIPESWYTRLDGQQSAKGVEGFLFPQTYQFNPGVTAPQVLKEMVEHFMEVAERIGFTKKLAAAGNPFSPYEALILASMSQAEAGVTEDLGKISRVGYNRIKKHKMPLEYDVTTNYWRQLQGKPKVPSNALTDAEMKDPRNTYRTHGKLGLPPGPICSPGEAALRSAAEPTPGEWIFFVAVDKEGHSKFATTDKEHERNKREAEKNGVL